MTPRFIQVYRYPAQAWTWAPPSLKTVSMKKVRGCRCHGTGNLGRFEDQLPGGYAVIRDIPCPCLHAMVDDSNMAKVAREIDAHFLNNKTEGILCRCMFCDSKRKEDEKASATIIEATSEAAAV